jgi:hypothetical protein
VIEGGTEASDGGAWHETPAESLMEHKLRSHNWAQEKYKRAQTQLPVASKPALMTRFTTAISIFTTAARPIRVDHTNCLQVAIKTHSFHFISIFTTA